MKVWELTCEGDKFDSFEPVKMWSVEKRQSFDGRSHKLNWKKEKVKRMDPWKGLELGDYPGFEIPAFSGHAKNLLSPLIDDYVEFLPLQSEEGEFFGVNITKVINGAIDYNKSIIDRFNDGRVMTIDEYEFVEEKISGIPIFKIEELKIGSPQFVTEKFVQLVKDNHLDGFCFDLVWDSEVKKETKVNLYQKKYEDRISSLSFEYQEILENYDDMLFPFLEKIEEVKKPLIREGTIFAVQFGGKYCFGKVMCMKPGISNISRENFAVCFFNELSDDLYVYPKQISINNLLLGPIFICDYFWKIGVCYSIDYIPLTEEEKELDIGYFCSCKDEKIKIYHFMGQEIFHDPQILTPCIESMLEDLEKELIIELMLKGIFRIEGQV